MRGHTYAQCIIYIYIYIVSVCICIIPFMDELRKKTIHFGDRSSHSLFFDSKNLFVGISIPKRGTCFFQGKKIQPSVFLSTIYMIYT